MKKSYADRLRDPRWQKKRLEIFERDGFSCRDCKSTDKELQVHHCVYIPGLQPWEYPEDLTLTLCYDCHPIRQKYEIAAQCAIARLLRDEPLELLEKLAWRLTEQAIEESHSGR